MAKFGATLKGHFTDMGDKMGLKADNKPIPDDALDMKRIEAMAYHNVLKALRDDLKASIEIVAKVAEKNKTAEDFDTALKSNPKASWSGMDQIVKKYSSSHSENKGFYESHTRHPMDNLLNQVNQQIEVLENCAKKIEKRIERYWKMIETDADLKKQQTLKKKTDKQEAAHAESSEKYLRETEELEAVFKDLLTDREEYLTKTMTSFVDLQKAFFNTVSIELGKCDSAILADKS